VFPFLAALIAAAEAAESPLPPDVDTPRTGNGRATSDAALVVGVEDYAGIADAPSAGRDAAAFAEYLRLVRGVRRVELLIDPDRGDIRAGLRRAAAAVRPRGTLWVYFAGQGAVSETGRRVLLGMDANPASWEGISLEEVSATAASSRCRQALVVVDASFGGIGRGGEPLGGRSRELDVLQPSNDKTSTWLAQSGSGVASEYPAARHGLFTYLVLGALRGWADGSLGGLPNGEVTLEEAQGFVSKATRIVGGKSFEPTEERRDPWVRFSLVRGVREDPPTPEMLRELGRAEKQRRVSVATAALLAQAQAEWMEIAIGAPSAAREAAVRGFVERYDAAVVTLDGVDVAVVVPQVQDARGRLDAIARALRKKEGKSRKKKEWPKLAPPPPVPPGPCADLVALEPAAITGALSPEEMSCLESRLASETRQTSRDKISRVLLANADGRADSGEWMRLAARHLETIDRSDPDLCFRYALILSRDGDVVDDSPEIQRWVAYALENKMRWQGPEHTSRVYNLYRLQAETVGRSWEQAELDFMDERTEQLAAQAESLRGQAKNSAKEWLDWATLTDQPPARARVLCETAAGSPSFCETPPRPEMGAELGALAP
jgi:hypothetical protein